MLPNSCDPTLIVWLLLFEADPLFAAGYVSRLTFVKGAL
jgi:hypothetical protein